MIAFSKAHAEIDARRDARFMSTVRLAAWGDEKSIKQYLDGLSGKKVIDPSQDKDFANCLQAFGLRME